MATKKTTTKKVPTTKKPAAQRASAKKSNKKAPAAPNSSLSSLIGLRPEETQFMTFRLTKQTLYWIVLGIVVILFTAWLMKLQMDIQDLYDQIDATTTEMSAL